MVFMGATAFARIACAQDDVKKVSDTTIGQVVWVKGTVKAMLPDKNARTLKRRDAIYVTDTLTSGPDGSGQVVFSDGALLALKEESSIKISEYKFDKAAPGEDKNVLEVVKGGFRTITGAIAKVNPKGYEIKTPVATIGVRGTDFSFTVDQKCDKNSDAVKCGLAVKINKGLVSLTNDDGSVTLDANSNNKYGRVRFSNKMPFVTSKDFSGMLGNELSLEPASWGGGKSGSGGGTGGSGSGGFCIQ